MTINTYLDDPTLIQVRAEDRRGGYLAAKHLIDLGHRNILFIGAVQCGFMNNDQRYAGYCDALEEARIAPNPDNLMTNLFPFNAERGIALGRQLAARRDFTGICVSAVNAVIEATKTRIVPVTMASGTTILGMLPLLGDAMFAGMAATIMGGLFVSTILTIFVLPVTYCIFFKIKSV